jgi:hypothetical protein
VKNTPAAYPSLGMPAAGRVLTMHTPVVPFVTQLIAARNDAQGGASAWSPPV